MPITDTLIKNASLYADEVALVEINPEIREKRGVTWRDYELVETNPAQRYRREMTWASFNRRANRFANLLLSRSITKGKKVALLLMNCLEWLPIYFGTLKSGAVVVPLNYRYSSDEIKYCLELAEADVLVFGPEFVGRVEALVGTLGRCKDLIFVGADCPYFAESYDIVTRRFPSKEPEIPLDDSEDAAIYFSSGTTGFPKAILHAHQSLVCSAVTEQKNHHQNRDDNFLCIPPLYHTGAKMHWFGSFLAGSKAVLLRGVKPEWILKAVSEENVTIVWLLVPWAQDILDAIERGEINLDDYHLDQWRLMHIGAQPVPPSLITRWKQYFPHHDYDTNYGLSESIGPGCIHLGIENIHKVGAIGIAGYGWENMIADENGNEVPDGDVGELCIKGPGVMKCYYRDEEATNAVLKNGWLFTGDMAMRDSEGFIYLVDRKKDVIITGGENLYPVQIEDFLRSCEHIKDVAVIGLPDARLGEIAAAIIELKEGHSMTEKDVEAFCAGMPRYKRPRKIIFDEVPRNPTGKIEKPKLRAKFCGNETLVDLQIKK